MKELLEDDVIRLRAIEPEDLDLIYRWENDTELWEAGSGIAPFSRKILWDYIENYSPDIYAARQLRMMIVLKATDEAVGTLDLYDFDPQNKRAGIGLLIDRRYVRNGYGSRALSLAVAYSRRFIDMHQLWAVVAIDNLPSMSTFHKCGFKICGRLRSWLRRGSTYIDAYILQHLVAD